MLLTEAMQVLGVQSVPNIWRSD